MNTCQSCGQEIVKKLDVNDPNNFPSYWDAIVLAEHPDEILVKIIPTEGKDKQHPAVGKSAWVYRSDLCTENTLVHVGDKGLLVVAGWVAESNDWM